MPAIALPLGSMFGDIADLVLRSGIFAKCIILLLAVLSVFSWAIMIYRARVFRVAERGNRIFWKQFAKAKDGDLGMAELAAWCEKQPGSPLAQVFLFFSSSFWPTYLEKRGGPEEERLLLGIFQRGARRVGSTHLERLERPLTWLAIFSSVSPFLGLLGTVWGIMGSFLQLGRQGSATLDVVGPGIAEALITTVCGLAVAIPAVVGYNLFLRRLNHQEAEVGRLASMLSDVVSKESLDAITSRV